MPAAALDTSFKRELVKALNLLEGNWGNEDAAAVIKPLLKLQDIPFYILNVGIMEEPGINTHRHIYLSVPQKLSPIETKDYMISFLPQPNLITDGVTPYLQLLDMLLLFREKLGRTLSML